MILLATVDNPRQFWKSASFLAVFAVAVRLLFLKMGSAGPESSFRRIQSFTPDYASCAITQYESEKTGMRVVVVDQEGPKLFGYFVLATEIHDDSGAPHTLEHLCFMGSKNYRYKGFLDKLATRAYSGTNAWTATDHTAYTLETAGWAGFAQILPIYLEHVLVPTLTDAGCTTEVHHIDGEGNDAGVVYSEMQALENTLQEIVDLRTRRLLYPEGVGFRYETGGMLERLRDLTAERIRRFHRTMYQPKNLCVALFGQVDHAELMDILTKFESSIQDDIPSPDTPFSRPWIESKQAIDLTESVLEHVEFPEEDESFGQVDIRFLGPDCTDPVATGALNIVLLYLAGSSAAVLDNTLVEREQLASGVYFSINSRPKTEIGFTLYSIETARLQEVESRFFEVLQDAMSKPLDMRFMKDCLEGHVRTAKFAAESSATSFADAIVADYLFGKRNGSTLQNAGTLKEYEDTLAKWSETQWKDFITKYISDAHHVSIISTPSVALSEKLKLDEAARLEKQKIRLGPTGLKEQKEKLEEAKEDNDKPIPSELLGRFKIPSTDSIHFVKTPAARVGPALKIGRPKNKYQSIVDSDGKQMPLFIDFEHIPSNFVRVNLVISTEKVPVELKPLLAIYLEAFFTLPITRNNEKIEFEQVVMELERETVRYSIDSAIGFGNAECIRINFQVEDKRYQDAIRWIQELLWNAVFDPERLQAINTRLLADIPDSKRSGDDMLAAVHLMTHLAPESIGRARSTLVNALYLKRIKYLLKTSPEVVIKYFETIRQSLCQFPNLRVLVVANLDKLANPVSSWQPFLQRLDTTQPITELIRRRDCLSPAGKNPGSISYIVPMATIDSSFLFAYAKGPSSFDDPRFPSLVVAMSYINAVEGPLWTAVRGTGLAYGTNVGYDIEAGAVHLDVYRSPDAYKAFDASRKIVSDHITGEKEFDPLMLEGAISSIVVGFANEQATLASAATDHFVRQVMKGLPEDYMETMLKKVREISVDEIKEALRSIVQPLFVAETSNVLITCAPGLTKVSVLYSWRLPIDSARH